MNDPHVASLTYRVIESDSLEFEDAPDLNFSTPKFVGHLSQGTLTLEPKHHYASEAEVRPQADAFVRAWEIDAGLSLGGRPDFKLRFHGSQLVDRSPDPGSHAVQSSTHAYVNLASHIKVTKKTYPSPPAKFEVTPEVQAIWTRYCGYVANREPLLSMGYACFTLMKRDNLKNSAKYFGIEYAVLKKLSELTTTRGDHTTARKVTANMERLTEKEKAWIEEAIKRIIRHLATREPSTQLTMRDLPSFV